MTEGQPDPARYADGQYWDTALYTLPEGVVYGTVRLLYQTASKEYIEFLRDNNDPATNNGQILYDLWQQTSMSAPEVMAEVQFGGLVYLPFVVSGDELMQLRPAQEEILKYENGRLAISAVPGSGKTFTLSLLAAQLIGNGRIDPEAGQQILIVTYLNASVDTFRPASASGWKRWTCPPTRL